MHLWTHSFTHGGNDSFTHAFVYHQTTFIHSVTCMYLDSNTFQYNYTPFISKYAIITTITVDPEKEVRSKPL